MDTQHSIQRVWGVSLKGPFSSGNQYLGGQKGWPLRWRSDLNASASSSVKWVDGWGAWNVVSDSTQLGIFQGPLSSGGCSLTISHQRSPSDKVEKEEKNTRKKSTTLKPSLV